MNIFSARTQLVCSILAAMVALPIKIILAVISGTAVYALQSPEIPGVLDNFTVFFGVGGSAFALGVLFPYLKRDRLIFWRGAGLLLLAVAAWAAAYYSAISVPSFWSLGLAQMDWRVLVPGVFVGSVVGASIVLIGAPKIATSQWIYRYLWYGVPASIVAGIPFLLMSMIDERVDEIIHWWNAMPYCLWHMTIAGILHVVHSKEGLENQKESLHW